MWAASYDDSNGKQNDLNVHWLEIAKLNNFRKFKEQTDTLVHQDVNQWDRRELGTAFLGGHDPPAAEVGLSAAVTPPLTRFARATTMAADLSTCVVGRRSGRVLNG